MRNLKRVSVRQMRRPLMRHLMRPFDMGNQEDIDEALNEAFDKDH